MGLPYHLTKPNYDFTPVFIKAYSPNVYGELSGNSFSPTVSGPTLDQTDFNEYDASLIFDGVNDVITFTGTSNLDFNSNSHQQAGQRLLIVNFGNNLSSGTNQGLYEWYEDANNYEVLYIRNIASVITLYYKVVKGGVTAYDSGAQDVTSSFQAGRYNVFQVMTSPIGAGTGTPTVEIYVNGILEYTAVCSIASPNSGIAFTGNCTIGKVRAALNIVGSDIYLNGRFDVFLTRRGRMFSFYHGGTAAGGETFGYGVPTRTWTLGTDYNNTNLLIYDLGSLKSPNPTVFPPKQVPQNIPCFEGFDNKLFIMGMGNHKVYPMNDNVNTALPILVSVTDGAGAGNILAGAYTYGITLLDSRTGQESQFLTTKDVTLVGATSSADIIIRIGCDTSRADYFKVYRKIGGQWYYVMMGQLVIQTISATGAIRTATFVDTYATADLTAINNINDDDLFAVSSTTLAAPTALTLTGGIASTNSFAGDKISVLAVNVDPFTGAISPPIVSSDLTLSANPNAGLTITWTGGLGPPYLTIFYIKNKTNGEQYWYQIVSASGYYSSETVSRTTGTIDPTLRQSTRFTDISITNPPVCNICFKHVDRMFYGCVDKRLNRVYYSEINDPERVGSLSYFDVGDQDEPITGGTSFGGIAVIFKEHSLYILSGYSPDTFEVRVQDKSIGCIAHQTIKIADNKVLWAAQDGIYSYDGSTIRKLSDRINDYFIDGPIATRPLMSAALDDVNDLYLVTFNKETALTPVDSNESINYEIPFADILVYHYRSEKDIWTSWAGLFCAINEGIDQITKQNQVFFTAKLDNLIIERGGNFGRFDPLRTQDINAKVDGFIDSEWLGQPVTMDFGQVMRPYYLHAYFEPDLITEGQDVELGYKRQGIETISNFTLEDDTVRLRKKINTRGKFIQPLFRGSFNEAFKLLGFDFKMTDTRG